MEHEIFRFAKMILGDACSTSYDLASLFRGRRMQAQHFTQMECKYRKTEWYEAFSSAFSFPFLKEVSQNCLSTSKIKENLQNCFVFEVVKFKKKKVSQICFVFKLAERQIR